MRATLVNRAGCGRGKRTEGLILALLLGLIFLAMSLLRIYGDMSSALFGGETRIAPLEQSIFGMTLGYRLAGFTAALILLHCLLGVFAWAMACLSRRAWPRSRSSQRVWTCLWMVLIVSWILAANAAWFPSSSLGSPYASFVQLSVLGIDVFFLATMTLIVAFAVTAASLLAREWHSFRMRRPAIAIAAGLVLLAVFLTSLRETTVWTSAVAGPVQPNIIIIGLDSVRTDVVQGPDAEDTVPALESFLREATVLSDTTTPLARTYSAWVSIITGRHPHTTGATVNLFPRDLIDTGPTLPSLLAEAGYDTVYGIDEVRFSNIDESYGFARTIGPRIGSADFLIEFFGDTPLSNLVVNTRLGDMLFPELHGNRAAEVTYDPDTFIDDVARKLYFDSPTLLAVHLTLAHWPFTWADSHPDQGLERPEQIPALYDAAIRRLDRQFADLMTMLERKGALENAIVIVLSDHGESLGEVSPAANAEGEISPMLGKDSIFGHGTHVFSREQYQVLLGIRTFGDTPLTLTPGARIQVPASLEDITPTLLEALGIDSGQDLDGRSLVHHLDGTGEAMPRATANRIRFLETEFNPPGVAVEERVTTSAIAKASASYRIDPETDRLEVRRDQLPRILATRQYAAISGDHMLVSVPAANLQRQHLVYLGPATDGAEWLDALPEDEVSSVRHRLWTALSARFELVASRPVIGLPLVTD